jgi:hypothetical protein
VVKRQNEGAALVTASHVAVYNWTFLLGQSLMPGINALLLGSLLYRRLAGREGLQPLPDHSRNDRKNETAPAYHDVTVPDRPRMALGLRRSR